jgi:hypothetical protein
MRCDSTPASASASFAAATPSGTQRETWGRSPASTWAVFVETGDFAGNADLEAGGIEACDARTPLRAFFVAFQNCSRPMPLGLTAPIPVITTRRFIFASVLRFLPSAHPPV